MSDDIEQENSSNLPTEEVANTEAGEETFTQEVTEDAGDDIETLRLKNIDLYDRARKAEAQMRKLRDEQKQLKESSPTPSGNDSLSTKDLYALMEAKVPQDDIDDVVEYAKLKKLPVAQALKTNVVKAILAEKAEERRTAEATNVGATRRGGPAKLTPQAVLQKAREGKLPDDVESLVEARFAK